LSRRNRNCAHRRQTGKGGFTKLSSTVGASSRTNRGAPSPSTRRTYRCAHKLELIAPALAHLPVRSCIIDGELTACDQHGLPKFHALHFYNERSERCVWAFDLLYLDGDDLRGRSLSERKHRLEKLVLKVRAGWLRFSESFTEGAKLLVAGDRMGLEGVVSKKAIMPQRSGSLSAWIKVKCPGWRERNRDRWHLFERP